MSLDTKRLKVAEDLGAIPINGSEVDVIEKVKELTNGTGPEIILDAAGHFTVVQQAVEDGCAKEWSHRYHWSSCTAF